MTSKRVPAPAGSFTDDTLRTIANARVILAGEERDPAAYVRSIKRVFRDDPRGGWSSSFETFLRHQADRPDEEWFNGLIRRNTNGALMGAPVMGVLADAGAALEAGRLQAFITHDEEAADFAGLISLTSFALRTAACEPRDLLNFVCEHAGPRTDQLRRETIRADIVDMSAARTAGAILCVLTSAKSLRNVIDIAVNMGGDTDSVAAATLGIASQAPQHYEPDLPEWCFSHLEGPDRGSDARFMLRGLDTEIEAFLSPTPLPI